MLENGGLLGILIACCFCGVFVILAVISNKKTNKMIDEIIHKLSKEDIDKLIRSSFHDYKENGNFLIGTSLIYDIVKKVDKFEIKLIFYDNYLKRYTLDSIFINQNIYNQKNFKVGNFVETLHNKAMEVRLKIKEIL